MPLDNTWRTNVVELPAFAPLAHELVYYLAGARAATLNPSLPAALSQIVLRLLEKEPDNRYQTAHGVVYDLARVRDLRSEGVIR